MRSRSWNAQRNGVNAPRSIDVVPSQTMWEMIRLISHAITRSTLQRGVISAHQLFGREREADVVRHRRQIVGAVGERDDLVVVAVLAELFEPRVQVAEVWDTAYDRLTIELHH